MRRLVAVAAVGLALVAASCGGGGGADDDGVATLTGADGGDVDATTSTTVDPEEAMLAFAECMRDNGVDFPDPGADGRMEISIEAADEEEWKAAEEACEDLRPQMAPMSDEDRAELEEQLRAMAECLRDRGFDVPDPEIRTPGDGGVMVRQQAPTDFDPDDPDFQEAQRACQEEVGMEDGPMLGARRGSGGGGAATRAPG